MARFRIDSIATLARQLTFSPAEARLVQLSAAEELLHTIDPGKAYPLDFVTFRVTGYHPRAARGPAAKPVDETLLTGLGLQHDLGLLIEKVSDSLNLHTQALADPVLTIEQACERFNVTSKTIQRWRRKGLPGRRFVFPDGKRRVGFLVSSVERFFAGHRDSVVRGGNFSQVGEGERDEILRRARRLAGRGGCCRNEIARRIARRLDRSPQTVLHTIRKHDEENPESAIFPQASPDITDRERALILKGYKRGVGIKCVARRVCRTRSAVYRVILDERIARLNKRKVKAIDDPLYHEAESERIIDELVRQETLEAPGNAEQNRVPADLPPYLQALYREPLLTPSRERALFLKFNFHKWQFLTERRRLDPQFARARDIGRMEGCLRLATDTKNAIVRANLRLVVSIARKHLRPGLNLMELISDGNLTLMRAVESFDVHKGNRFSTYATLALMKGFARSVPVMLAGSQAKQADEQLLASVPDRRLSASPERALERTFAREDLRTLMGRLSERERRVLLTHYGIESGGGRMGEESRAAPPATYDQVARRLGLSKQRVRQIEQSAMAKLRAAVGAGEA